MAKAVIRDQSTGVVVGLGLIVGGAFVLYDAYERRGASRPFWLRLFGGWV